MALSYVKLAHVTADIAAEVLTQVDVLAAMVAGELIVVNLKGRPLTPTELRGHLPGSLDGEDLEIFMGTDADMVRA